MIADNLKAMLREDLMKKASTYEIRDTLTPFIAKQTIETLRLQIGLNAAQLQEVRTALASYCKANPMIASSRHLNILYGKISFLCNFNVRLHHEIEFLQRYTK